MAVFSSSIPVHPLEEAPQDRDAPAFIDQSGSPFLAINFAKPQKARPRRRLRRNFIPYGRLGLRSLVLLSPMVG